MIIANPISDLVFKWMMDDARIARFFIETILEENVTEVEVKPQEITTLGQDQEALELANLALFRLDFVATIKTGIGTYKKVLIEIQKARKQTDIMRFRNYLGEQYRKEDEVNTTIGKTLMVLPIVTIYLLGFKLPEINTPVVKVSRVYTDQITHQTIEQRNDFIEKLTHDSFVVQIPRIESKLQTKLQRLLTFFEQNYFVEPTGVIKEYPYQTDDEEIKRIAEKLHFVGTDPENRKRLAIEQESYRIYYSAQKENLETIKELEEQLGATEAIVKRQEEEIAELTRKLLGDA